MLIVSSGSSAIKLRSFVMPQRHAQAVVARLVSACASFYYEPEPDDVGRIVVAEEHQALVQQLWNEVSWAME